MAGGETSNDPIISRLIAEDKVPWYKKPNLRILYLIMFPTCIGIEMTSGYVGLIPSTATLYVIAVL